LVKLLQCSRATLVPAVLFGVFLVALGLARDAAVHYYLLIVLLILAAMTLATAGVMSLVILITRLIPARKVRSWMPVAVALVTVVLMLGQQWATQWFLGQPSLITSLTEALLDPEKLAVVAVRLAGLAMATSLVTYQIFNKSFHEGWNRFRVVPTEPAPVSLAGRRPRGVSRLVQPLSAPLRQLLVKEWLELRRDPRVLINLVQPLVFVAFILAPFVIGGKGVEELRPILFWFMLMFLLIFLGILPIGAPLMAIAREGRNMALLRSAPISMSEVLKGKFWAMWLPMVLSWGLILALAGLWLQFPLWQIGFLVATIVWGLTGGSAVAVAIGGLSVDFTIEEPKRRISTPAQSAIMALNIFFVLLTLATFVWLMVRLCPGSDVVLVIQALAGYGAVGWIISDAVWPPFALVSGQVAFGVGVKVLWDAAIRRLERWEDK